MTDSKHAGGCACGAVRFLITGELTDVIACHCETCRRTSGYHWAATHVQRAALSITQDAALTWWASSDIAERAFCGRCGSSLFYQRHDSRRISVAPGALDGPTGLSTTAQICCAEAGDYYRLDERAACYPGPEIVD